MPTLRLSRRALVRAAVALTGGLVASACAPKVGNETGEVQKEVAREVAQGPAQKEQVVIRFGKFAGDVWAHDDLFAKKFMEENPHINVQIEDVIYGEAFKKGLALAATGTLWDVFSGFTRWMPYLAWKGVCLQLDDMIESHDIDFDDFFPSVIADVKLWMDNRMYWLPSIVHPAGNAGLAMNKTLMDEAGAELAEGAMEGDWTINDLEQVMRAVAKPKEIFGMTLGANQVYRAQQLCRCWGEDPQKGSTDAWLLSADGKKVQLGDEWPRVKAALDWGYGLIKDGIVPTSADMQAVTGSDLFSAGKQLATGMSVDHVPRLVGQVGDRFEMIFVPWPKGPNGHRGSALSYINQSASSQTKHPEEAFLLVAQLTGKEHALYRAEMEGGCTMARHSASFSEKLWSQPSSGPLMRFAAQWLEAGVDPFPQLHNLRAMELDSVYSQEVAKFLNGEEDWIQMVAHATKACQAVADLERP